MKKRIIQFLTTYFLFVLLFALQKPIFMVYYRELYINASLGDYFRVMWHGLPLDLSLAGYLTAIPGLLLIASAWTDSSVLRRIRQVYFGLIAFIMACIFIVDLGLYGFWGFRLDATPIFYFFSSPKDAMASVSFLVRTAGDSSHADLRRYFILHFLLRTDPREEPHEDTLSPAKCLPRIIITDGSAFHPYPRRFHRIDHELKQSIFQLRPTDEPCRH